MERVAIIVLNWNGADDTLQCLDSLLNQTYKDFHIAVVDNKSTDNSVELLREYQSKHQNKITLIRNPKNLGFAGGVNTGIKWGIDGGFKYIALFNNDAIADKDWLKSLVLAIEPKDIGISTSLLLHEDGKTIDSTGDWYSKWGLPFPRSRDDEVSQSPEKGFVFSGSGGASLYKSEMLKNIGLFDEDFFAYYEDTDISFRAQLAGWKIVYEPSAVAFHKRGVTANKMPGFSVYQTFKNLPQLYIKNVPRGLLFSIGIRLFLAYYLMLGNAVVKGKGIKAIKGCMTGIVLGFKAVYKRRYIQKNKRVSTEYIKNLLWDDLPPEQSGLRKVRRLFTGKR